MLELTLHNFPDIAAIAIPFLQSRSKDKPASLFYAQFSEEEEKNDE